MIRKSSFFTVFVMLALLFTLGGQAQPASAQDEPSPVYRTITVTTTKDDIKKNGNCTLREAVQVANTNKTVDRCPAGSSSSTDVIKLGRGTYVLSIKGAIENANKKGDIDITQSVKILGSSRSSTIIDGKMIDRVFDNRSNKAAVTLQDLTIQNGYTIPIEGTSTRLSEGGAVANIGKMYLTRVRFYNNELQPDGYDYLRGGAIFNNGTLSVTDCIFEKNSGGSGGAIANSGILKVDKSTFKNNFGYSAGAIYSSRDGSRVDITNSRFQGNENGPGGAAVMTQYDGVTNISKSTFEANIGGVLIENHSTMTVRYSTFTNNRSFIFESREGYLTFTHSTVKINSSEGGGGVYLYGGRLILDRMTFNDISGPALEMSGGDARLNNSTITGLKGGRGVIKVDDGYLSIEMATIADNATNNSEDPTEMVGALNVTGGTVTLHSTILANTTRESDGKPVPDCQVAPGTTTSRGYNLISRGDGCALENGTGAAAGYPSDAAAGDQIGTLADPIDPMLGVLKNNGGYNYTRGLLPGSPAIDKADPLNYFKTDQRVYHRPAGSHCDIGAYERGAVK